MNVHTNVSQRRSCRHVWLRLGRSGRSYRAACLCPPLFLLKRSATATSHLSLPSTQQPAMARPCMQGWCEFLAMARVCNVLLRCSLSGHHAHLLAQLVPSHRLGTVHALPPCHPSISTRPSGSSHAHHLAIDAGSHACSKTNNNNH
jgi:hypothetical protein